MDESKKSPEEVRHNSVLSSVEIVGKDGSLRSIPKIQYRRTPVGEAEAESFRLGPLAKAGKTQDPSVLGIIKEQKKALIICNGTLCQIIAATRLQYDKTSHKVLTGTEILKRFLSSTEEGDFALHEGFAQFKQLYIFFGYIEAKNGYLASLVSQLVGQRHYQDNHVWLFVPNPLAQMALKWTNAILDVKYLPTFSITSLSDLQKDTSISPESQANIVPVTKENFLSQSMKIDLTELGSSPQQVDPKLGKKKKRRF